MDEELNIFISYSRHDALDFAEQLEAMLRDFGFTPFRDQKNISPGEDWKGRLTSLILKSDTIVFVMSPEAVKSDMCQWEVEQAQGFSKRILPVIAMPLGNSRAPESLARMHYIYFYPEPSVPGSGFYSAQKQLKAALVDDIDWIRDHTYYGERAMRWNARARTNARLLVDDDLAKAVQWVKDRKTGAPEITSLQREFIDASEKLERDSAEAERKRIEERVQAALSQTKSQNGPAPFQDHPNTPRMVAVTPSEFLMGSQDLDKNGRANERPCHRVCLCQAFAMGIYPITIAEWNFACSEGFQAECRGFCARPVKGTLDHPVTGIPWDAAVMFARWLASFTGENYRLPSEAEWEFACRAGTTNAYAFGEGITTRQATFKNRFYKEKVTAEEGATPVGLYPSNAFGIYDMHGNVWEWVADDYHSSFEGAPSDGSAWVDNPRGKYRILRGGCFASGARHLRCARRAKATRTPHEPDKIGFRVARDL